MSLLLSYDETSDPSNRSHSTQTVDLCEARSSCRGNLCLLLVALSTRHTSGSASSQSTLSCSKGHF